MAVAGDLDFSEDKTVQVAALQLVSSFVLQNSVTGPEKKLEKAIAYTACVVQLCSHAHLIMWIAHSILCKQQLQLARS